MNKKLIEKLAVESLVYVNTGLDDGQELIFSKEKFAELIVRECSIICKESGDVPAVLVSEDILLHFGVEE